MKSRRYRFGQKPEAAVRADCHRHVCQLSIPWRFCQFESPRVRFPATGWNYVSALLDLKQMLQVRDGSGTAGNQPTEFFMRNQRSEMPGVAVWKWLIVGGLTMMVSGILLGREPASPEELVRQLGDANFRVRESAAEALIRLGHKALPALQAGMNDSDPEIRRRCRELYPQAMAYDLEVRIKQFLAADDDRADTVLPGWRMFREIAGKDAAARRFFADIYRYGHTLLDKAERASRSDDVQLKRQVQEEYARLCDGLTQQAFNQITGQPGVILPEQFAAALLLGCFPINDEALVPQARQIYNLCNHTSVRQFLQEKTEQASVLRRLLVGVALKSTDMACLQQILQLALNINLPEAQEMARRHAENKEMPGYVRGLALTVVAKYGGQRELAFLERFLADASLVTTTRFARQNEQINIRTELRDLALALAIDLTGQRLQDYAFPALQVLAVNSHLRPTVHYIPHYYGFSTTEQREAAFKKWHEWRQNHPQP
jgi:hypothetical protein